MEPGRATPALPGRVCQATGANRRARSHRSPSTKRRSRYGQASCQQPSSGKLHLVGASGKLISAREMAHCCRGGSVVGFGLFALLPFALAEAARDFAATKRSTAPLPRPACGLRCVGCGGITTEHRGPGAFSHRVLLPAIDPRRVSICLASISRFRRAGFAFSSAAIASWSPSSLRTRSGQGAGRRFQAPDLRLSPITAVLRSFLRRADAIAPADRPQSIDRALNPVPAAIRSSLPPFRRERSSTLASNKRGGDLRGILLQD